MLWQAKVKLQETMERHRVYAEALQVARDKGKPLLVVGGPHGSNPLRHIVLIKAHGCGDMCLDIDPAACQGCPYTKADIREIPFPDSTFGACFASHVVEHLPTVQDAELAILEMQRVADEVFVVAPSKQDILAWFHSGHHLWVKQTAAGFYIEQR